MDVIKTSFIYSKLEENEEVQPIRVLKLYPSADFNHRIECELLFAFWFGCFCLGK